MGIILHITDQTAWEEAVSTGCYTPSSLESDGFIHCSTIAQTAATANQFYRNQHNLVLLCIDEYKLGPAVKYEAPACAHDQRIDALFPHIYGPLSVSAVVRVVTFKPQANGEFLLPDEVLRLSKG